MQLPLNNDYIPWKTHTYQIRLYRLHIKLRRWITFYIINKQINMYVVQIVNMICFYKQIRTLPTVLCKFILHWSHDFISNLQYFVKEWMLEVWKGENMFAKDQFRESFYLKSNLPDYSASCKTNRNKLFGNICYKQKRKKAATHVLFF